MKKYLEIGRVINKRGIAGELKVECYCDSPAAAKKIKILYLDENGQNPREVQSIKDYKGYLYIKLKDVTTVEQADKMRSKMLYAKRNDIDVAEGSIFIADLLGLDVKDADSGKVYGKIDSVENYGASNIYVIKDGKNTYLMPETDDIIVEIILDDCMRVRPMPGVFDDAEEIK